VPATGQPDQVVLFGFADEAARHACAESAAVRAFECTATRAIRAFNDHVVADERVDVVRPQHHPPAVDTGGLRRRVPSSHR